MSDSKESFPNDLTPLPASELIDEPETIDTHRQPAPADLLDLLLRVERMEEQFGALGRQTGSGSLSVFEPPVEDTSEATPQLIWRIPGPLTCQTSKGKNLLFYNFELHVWKDARIRLNGPFRNVSGISNWDVTVNLAVWFKSGHATRPVASASFWFGEIRRGHEIYIDKKVYSDSLASIYPAYLAGELYLRFGINAVRTN